MLSTLAMNTDNAQTNFITVGVCQPGSPAIMFPKSWNFEFKVLSMTPFWEKNTTMWFCIHFLPKNKSRSLKI